MQTIKSLTTAFCAACIASGVLIRLMPDGTAQRFIKAVAGLYILVSVLAAAKNASPLSFLPNSESNASDLSLPSFETGVVQRSQSQLEQQYETRFQADGITVELTIPLILQNEELRAGTILVQSAEPLSQRQQTEICALLESELQPETIQFKTKDSGL